MVGATSSKVSGLPTPLCFGGFSRGGVQLIIHRSGTISRTRWTTRFQRMPKVPRLTVTSFLKSTKSVPKFNDLGIIEFSGMKQLLERTSEQREKLEKSLADQFHTVPNDADVATEEELLLDQGVTVHPTSPKRSLHLTISALFCDALERAMVKAFYGSSKPTNYYLHGNYGPVDEFGPQRVYSVRGYLPECLNGEFVRVGPNPRFQPIAKYHWFDGDGMLHGVRIKDGQVTYASRYVRTSRFQQEEHWGGPKFWRLGDLIGNKGLAWLALFQLRVALGVVDLSNGYGNANTAMTFHNGKLLALSESDKPYIVHIHEDGNLETVGRYDYDQKLNHPFTAHPKIDPVTGEMFTFGYLLEAHPYVTYRVISKDGVIGNAIPITPSGPIMMHDFAITENYAIFMDCPLYFSPTEMVRKNQDPFAFDETKPARFGVLPRYAKNESQIHWFEFSTCVIFHSANAWEEGDEVVVIACRSPSIDMETISVYDKEKADAFIHDLWEYRLNMRTGEAKERKLGEFVSDFPRINEEYVGRKNRYVYTALFEDATHHIGIAKYDLTLEPELGKEQLEVGGNVAGVYWFGNMRYGSEPVYVSKKPGKEVDEDDGYLLCFLFDENTWTSEVVVIDAKTMSSDPVAVIELPTRVPYGFHAMFVSENQLQLQKS
ncbi:unnamed protein product [Calypogeia fissa]